MAAPTEGGVVLEFSLVGNLEEVVTPVPSTNPVRADLLWMHTAAEVFASGSPVGKGQPYTELNLSPSGDYAVYSFTSFREGR